MQWMMIWLDWSPFARSKPNQNKKQNKLRQPLRPHCLTCCFLHHCWSMFISMRCAVDGLVWFCFIKRTSLQACLNFANGSILQMYRWYQSKQDSRCVCGNRIEKIIEANDAMHRRKFSFHQKMSIVRNLDSPKWQGIYARNHCVVWHLAHHESHTFEICWGNFYTI